MIESTHVMPSAAGSPMNVNSACHATRTSSTSHFSGQRMVPIRSNPTDSVLSRGHDETVRGELITEGAVRLHVVDAALSPGMASPDPGRPESADRQRAVEGKSGEG